jgi:acylpyruvate hydrolase
MSLSTVRVARGRTAAARVEKRHVVLLSHSDVGALLARGRDGRALPARRCDLRTIDPAR